jgi:hypothetical protein
VVVPQVTHVALDFQHVAGASMCAILHDPAGGSCVMSDSMDKGTRTKRGHAGRLGSSARPPSKSWILDRRRAGICRLTAFFSHPSLHRHERASERVSVGAQGSNPGLAGVGTRAGDQSDP